MTGKAARKVLLFALVFIFLSATIGFSYLKIEPSFASLTVSNKSVDFQITIISEPGESNRVVTLSAGWPIEGELSWTERQMIVGTRQSTRISLTPRTPGDYYLAVSLSGDGVLPLEEYAQVTVVSPEAGKKMSDELSDLKKRISSAERKLSGLSEKASKETVDLFVETNSSIGFAEQFYSEGRQTLAENALSVARTNMPSLEARLSEEEKAHGVFSVDVGFLPAWAKTVSFDLIILIVIVSLLIALSAKTFLFGK